MGSFFSKQFDPVKDIPNLEGKVAVVTGANSGIGFQTALQLASHGAKVFLTVRSEAKAQDAISRMESQDPSLAGSGRLEWLVLDLASVRGTRKAAQEFIQRVDRLDILVNNASEIGRPYQETDEGISTSMASNHLGHFVWTTTLLPLLETTAKSPNSDVRVINIASDAHSSSPQCDFTSTDDFRNRCGPVGSESLRTQIGRLAQTKLANMLFTIELQRRWDEASIPALTISVHPGAVGTEGAQGWFGPWLFYTVGQLIFISPFAGAITPLFAATSLRVREQAETYKGAYVVPYGTLGIPSANARDEHTARNLWALSERVVKEIEENGRAE